MSRPVVFTSPGYHAWSSGVCSGQPRSRTARARTRTTCRARPRSCVSSVDPHSAHASGSVSAERSRARPAHSQTGIWCPHQIWREMYQSAACSRGTRHHEPCCDSGWSARGASFSASSAGFFSSSIAHHHWRRSSGSIRVPATLAERDRVPIRLSLLEQTALLDPVEDSLLGLLLRQAGELAGVLVHPPVEARSPIGSGRSWSRPISKSIGSCAGSHLQRAGAELEIHALVGDHRHRALDERDEHLADRSTSCQRVIRRIHGHRHVREHRRAAAPSRSSRRRRRQPAGSGSTSACRRAPRA